MGLFVSCCDDATQQFPRCLIATTKRSVVALTFSHSIRKSFAEKNITYYIYVINENTQQIAT